MDNINYRIYLKLFLKNWRIIILFVVITLIASVLFNFVLKKAPLPMYNIEGVLDVTGVVFPDKSVPVVVFEDMKWQNILNKTSLELRLNKSDFDIRLDTSKANVIKIQLISSKVNDANQYLDTLIKNYIEQIKVINNINDSSKESLLLNNKFKEKIENNQEDVLLKETQDELTKDTDEEKKCLDAITYNESSLTDCETRIDLSQYMIKKLTSKLNEVDSKSQEYLKYRILDQESELDRTLYYRDLYKNGLLTNQKKLKDIKQEINHIKQEINQLNEFNRSQVFNRNIRVSKPSAKLVPNGNSRERNVIVSLILALIISYCLILLKEYFFGIWKNRSYTS